MIPSTKTKKHYFPHIAFPLTKILYKKATLGQKIFPGGEGGHHEMTTSIIINVQPRGLKHIKKILLTLTINSTGNNIKTQQ